MDSKTSLKRKFLDSIKKSDKEIYIDLFTYLKSYIDKRNDTFNKYNNFIGKNYEDFKLINVVKYDDIRITHEYDTSKTRVCDSRSVDYLYANFVLSKDSEYYYSDAKMGFENIYYKDYALILKYSKFNWDIIRNVSKKYISNFFYETLLHLIPNLYKELSKIIFDRLGISKDEYYIQFDKLYSVKDCEDRFDCKARISDWENKYEPFICLSLYNIFNIETGDIYDKEKDIEFNYDKDSVSQTYAFHNYSFRDNNKAGVILFPFSNTISLKYYDCLDKYKGEAFDYTYNRYPNLSCTNRTNTETKNDNLSTFLPDGYFSSRIVIGNILNNLYCNIVKKDSSDTSDQCIIQFNQFGMNPSIVNSPKSIRAFSSYNKKNKEKIIDKELLSKKEEITDNINTNIEKYKNRMCSKLYSVNKKLFDDYKNFVINEVNNCTLYNEGLAKEHFNNKDGSLMAIYPNIMVNEKFLDHRYRCMSPFKSLKTYIPNDLNSYLILRCPEIMIQGRYKEYYKWTDYYDKKEISLKEFEELKYDHIETRSIYSKFTIEFGDTFNFTENRKMFNDFTELEHFYWYKPKEADLSNLDISTRDGLLEIFNHSSYTGTLYYNPIKDVTRAINTYIVITQYIKPFLDTYIPNVVCPIFKNFYLESKDLQEAFQQYKELESVNKKIKESRENAYSVYTMDSVSNFTQEVNFFNENLELTNLHLTSLYKD